MTKTLTVLTLCILIVAPAAFAGGGGPDGAPIFKAKCAMCHGPDGAGQTTMGKNLKLRDLRSAEVQKQTDAELVKWISDGKGKMPSYKGKLTPADIDAVVAFIRTLKK
ncbi:MAG TPA: cytochrome c [Thermoanaerobaculia bacterium]|nr:cytochrome c [Thermoanaerobaculia bacterium]